MDSTENALITAWLLNGAGGGTKLNWKQVKTWNPEQGVLWAHLNWDAQEAQNWLKERPELPVSLVDALTSEETRPRVRSLNEHLMLILRSVNLNPGADPDEMVQLRLLTDGKCIISLRREKIFAVQDIEEQLVQSKGPEDISTLISRLCERISIRISHVVDQLQDNVDELEETVLKDDTSDLRAALADMRHQGIALKRFILPQRDALIELIEYKPKWLNEINSLQLEQVADRTERLVEDLNAVRERAAVIQDELTNRLDERLNRIMYVLSIIAAIFLPLGFITGLFGINIGGMPGMQNPDAFYILCGVLVLIVATQIWLFKHWKWF